MFCNDGEDVNLRFDNVVVNAKVVHAESTLRLLKPAQTLDPVLALFAWLVAKVSLDGRLPTSVLAPRSADGAAPSREFGQLGSAAKPQRPNVETRNRCGACRPSSHPNAELGARNAEGRAEAALRAGDRRWKRRSCSLRLWSLVFRLPGLTTDYCSLLTCSLAPTPTACQRKMRRYKAGA